MAVFIIILRVNKLPGGDYPGWCELHRVFPFLIEVSLVTLVGVIFLISSGRRP
jgi:hypothetical protein